MNNLSCWLVTCRPGTAVLVSTESRSCPYTPRPPTGEETRVTRWAELRSGSALPPANPTGHPLVSRTGHQSCRATHDHLAAGVTLRGVNVNDASLDEPQ